MALANTLARSTVTLGNVLLPDDKPDALCVGKVLKLTVEQQNQDNWCWASVGAGVARAYQDPDPTATLCGVAGRVLSTTCCPTGDFSDCDQAKELDSALGGHMDTSIPQNVEKTFELVQDKINKGIPIAVRVQFPKTVGHFVVISGYCVMGGKNYVFVCDPQFGHRSREEFDGFLTRYRTNGSWHLTFVTKGIPGNGVLAVPEEV